MHKVLALNVNGDITYCTASPEQRGIGRCNHVAHQMDGETPDAFLERVSGEFDSLEEAAFNAAKPVSKDDVVAISKRIDEIAGVHVTPDNLKQVLGSLNPQQLDEITKIGFDAAPIFSLPVSEHEYEQKNVETKLYFANLPEFGVSGKTSAMIQMFDKIGKTPTDSHGGSEDIEHSYADGLTEHEYFARQYYARMAMIQKSVGTSKPGYCISADSTVFVMDEDGELDSKMWDEVDVGDVFVDGSKVEELREWQMKPCVEVKVSGELPLVVSMDHLMNVTINFAKGRVLNFAASREARNAIGETDPSWICANDLLECSRLGAEIVFSTGKHLEMIRVHNNGESVKVRCISTSLGFYETNGIVHHNTARKLFYAFSDTQVMEDCGGPYIDAMHCKLPNGHVCVKCAHMTKGGENVKVGDLIGGDVSTRLSEGLTQLSMEMKHSIAADQPVAYFRDGQKMAGVWSDIEVGDQLPSGDGNKRSTVLEVTPWDFRPSYKLVADGFELVVSDDHLLKVAISDASGKIINDDLHYSEMLRKDIGVSGRDSSLWIAAHDIFNSFIAKNETYIYSYDDVMIPLESIERFQIEPIKVRCVATDVGWYAVGPFINHNTGTSDSMEKGQAGDIIRATVDGWGTSPIIKKMKDCDTTEECRQVLYDGLKKEYDEAGVNEDDFNLMMIAKKMTSYKRTATGLRPVEPGERCDIVSAGSVGNSNNIFKKVELSAGYKQLTTPITQELKKDAANQILN